MVSGYWWFWRHQDALGGHSLTANRAGYSVNKTYEHERGKTYEHERGTGDSANHGYQAISERKKESQRSSSGFRGVGGSARIAYEEVDCGHNGGVMRVGML